MSGDGTDLVGTAPDGEVLAVLKDGVELETPGQSFSAKPDDQRLFLGELKAKRSGSSTPLRW